MPIVYPQFLLHTDDEFWRSVLVDLANANAPFGTVINHDTLSIYAIKSKDRFFFGEITDKQELQDKCIDFLRNSAEYTENYEFAQEISVIYQQWVNIKKKYIRDIFIHNYVISLRKQLNLTVFQTRNLLASIMLWFQFKFLNKEDVNYDQETRRITCINGVDIKPDGIITLKVSAVDNTLLKKSNNE